MKVSIVILNWNTLKYLKKCVKSIKKYTKDVEIIIVDNGSTEKGTEKYIKSVTGNYLIFDKNYGFSIGNNKASEIAKGEYLCFMNSDVTVGKGWLDEMLKTFESDKYCGAVGPLGNPETNIINGRQFSFTQYKGQYYSDTKVDCLIGFCLLIKNKVFKKIGGFDEELFNGFEDNLLSIKLRKLGYNLLVSSKSDVTHIAGAAHTANKVDYLESLKRNQIIFRRKVMELDSNE
jgi:GT2 family glycosyltransferase